VTGIKIRLPQQNIFDDDNIVPTPARLFYWLKLL